MKSECTYTQKQLPRYLTGHLFKLQQMRVERHLAECPVCSSQFDALRRIGETRHFLRDLESGGGVGTTVRSLGSAVMKLVYRPLWVVLIVISVTMLYRNVVTPILHDPDLEKLDAGTVPTAPASAPALTTASSPTSATAPVVQAASPAETRKETPAAAPDSRAESKKEAPPASDPLVVTITVDKDRERESIKRINEAMKEHALLRTMRFNAKVREVAGNLTADELTTFFNRIEDAAKITYKRSRLKAAGGKLVPVVLKLETGSVPARRDAVQPATVKPAEKPVEKPADKPMDKPVDNPVGTTLKTPAEQQAAPSRPAQ